MIKTIHVQKWRRKVEGCKKETISFGLLKYIFYRENISRRRVDYVKCEKELSLGRAKPRKHNEVGLRNQRIFGRFLECSQYS